MGVIVKDKMKRRDVDARYRQSDNENALTLNSDTYS